MIDQLQLKNKIRNYKFTFLCTISCIVLILAINRQVHRLKETFNVSTVNSILRNSKNVRPTKSITIKCNSNNTSKIDDYNTIYFDSIKLLHQIPKNVIQRENYLASNSFLQENLAKLEQAAQKNFDKDQIVAKSFLSSIYNQIFLGELDPDDPRFKITIDQENKEVIRNKRLPNVILIGAKKCGTAALQTFMEYHPKFHSSRLIEPHYYDLHYDKGLNWYLSTFPAAGSSDVLFEKSPRYLATIDAPKRVYDIITPLRRINIDHHLTNRYMTALVLDSHRFHRYHRLKPSILQ